MDETFSTIDLITQCLTDEKRTLKFQQAIEAAVKPGDVVLDSGTGSAVLALFAARAGAKKVVAVEFDPWVADLARQNIARNGYGDVIEVVMGDVRKLRLEEKVHFDVVIMEMLTTGMVDEYQVWAINNLHQMGYVNESTTFIPERQDTFIALTEMNFVQYGLTMRMVMHLWDPFPKEKFITHLSDTVLLDSVPFNRINPTDFSWEGIIEVSKSGTLNSLCLTSTTIIHDSIEVGDTLALNAPVAIPLEKDCEVRKGDRLECVVSYQFGNGYRNFKAGARVV
jgi:predicted RNA methylase